MGDGEESQPPFGASVLAFAATRGQRRAERRFRPRSATAEPWKFEIALMMRDYPQPVLVSGNVTRRSGGKPFVRAGGRRGIAKSAYRRDR